MRRALIVLLAAALAAWAYDSASIIVWVGGYDLAVRVECAAGSPCSVRAQAFAFWDDAEEIFATEHGAWPAIADPFDGSPLTMPVRVTGRESGLGCDYGRAQYRYLAVVAVFPDGRRVKAVADIPDGRECRAVTLALP